MRPSLLTLGGAEAAFASGVDEIAVFAAASETFSQKNINCTITESLERFIPVFESAKISGLPVRGYVSCVVDCPYEGAIEPSKAASVAQVLLQMGCYEVSLGDTTGAGRPETIQTMLRKVLEVAPVEMLAGHYHDTRGRAIDNIEASLELGLHAFDASISGLGGCPYAPGAKGNVATEVVVQRLHQLGYRTGVDLDNLAKAKTFIAEVIKKERGTNCRRRYNNTELVRS